MIKSLKIAAMLLVCTVSLQAQSADEKAIYALLQEGIDAFNAHDADRFAKLYAENADFVAPVGQILHGREQIRQAHAELFKMIPKAEKSTQEYIERKVRFLTPDWALLTAHWKSTDFVAGKEMKDEYAFTFLVRRMEGKWLVELTTLTPVQPMPDMKN